MKHPRNGSTAGERIQSVGITYENGDWLEPLCDQLDRSAVPYHLVDVQDAAFELHTPGGYAVYFNRVSPSSYLRGHGPAIGFARGLLRAIEARGTRVINGARSFGLEISKIQQHLLMMQLGVRTPKTMVFNNRGQVRERAKDFGYPAILKPNMGGSGAYVRRAESYEHLLELLNVETDLFGPDHLLLLQQAIESPNGSVVRTEFVDGELMYSMRVYPQNTFNLCPADACVRSRIDVKSGAPTVEFEHYPDVPDDAVAQAREIIREARLDVGGVEYIEDASGMRYFYDINATSVYRREICDAAGVDAFAKLGEFIRRELNKEIQKP